MDQPSSRPALPYEQIPLLPGSGRRGHLDLLRRDRLGLLRSLATQPGIVRMRFLKRVVAVTAPELVQQVLVEKARAFAKSAVTRYVLYPMAGEGLFTSNGDLWRRQRRLMAPLFTPGQIAAFADDMVQCAARDIDTFKPGQELDLLRETTRIAMSVAGKTLFDAETFSEADEIGAALTVALTWASDMTTSLVPVLQVVLRETLEGVGERLPGAAGRALRDVAAGLHGPVLIPGAEGRRLREAVAVLDRRVQRMIDERRVAGSARADLLSRLLAARDEDDGGAMSDRQIRDEVLTLFVAGHETTATALAWCVYLLCRHPEVYAAAQAEADALGRPPRLDDLPRLGLLSQIFRETLRLYPPVSAFTRDACADTEIGGFAIPRGTVVLMSPLATHQRPELWPDPERFDPSRFSPAADEARPRHAFLSFSGGPRVCIGNHFALMEGPLVLCVLLQRARYELRTPIIEPELLATLRPRGGVPVRVHLRGRPA